MSLTAEPREHVQLGDLNTLHVPAVARFYWEVEDADGLKEALAWAANHSASVLILGGGSNLVFNGDFNGLVIRICVRGRYWEHARNHEATLVLGGGENWHEAVLYAAGAGYRGIENLALIPGTAGAAPVQNIGAYGVELCDTLESVTALDRRTGEVVRLSNNECRFAYRDSLFKQSPGRYAIIEVRLRLSRDKPLQLGYRDLEEYLGERPRSELSATDVAEAVMAIRRRKLPDPDLIPNAGSFFKNPVVPSAEYKSLQSTYPDIVGYKQPQGVKLAAAWLIDQCGWKGFRNGRVGVHNRQALVLINHSGGTGRDILELAGKIRETVRAKFGVELEMEPGVVG
ncbi:UDP-N-acetylmuramate dehydrogenase [Marinobacter sp. M216]|uniref:UDP-N-acetylenolpyruvoylglucosamine reductase n=1 Tax=Marinobacter albus TaxID=3030833 RepID=A0ABT7HB42_9GAMM|nr:MULTISPECIES: UDP-N-acetylmuramate dehydrogenase [unclassified Marinobacter]MBW7470139.1 UDP-N-acetylmuramate dehydrogenase [Marinobacter sp. F4218]MDK9557597.1 UDP-N-acetylmuramate dehydrogenase [Marinobacter sp. M216]